MPDPSTRRSTPPQSTRIGQPVQTSATVVPAYEDTDFPVVAFTNQLAIDLTTRSLAYFDSNGAWQGVVSSSGVQTFYGPYAPDTTNLADGDRWYDTSTGIWNVWNSTKSSWMPGNAAYSSVAPSNPSIGQAWYDTGSNTLFFWNGTDWVLPSDPTAPGIYTGVMPDSAVAGSSWTDPNGIQYICVTTYASGTGSLSDWVQITIGADPLVNLIIQNGQLIMAQEIDTTNVYAGPSTLAPVTAGLVWLDITSGAPTEGDYFVYTGTEWRVVTAPSTLVLCAGLKVSQNAQGIVGTNLNYIWPDPLAQLVTLNSSFAMGMGSSNTALPGPTVQANISAVQVASNVATINVDTTGGLLAGRNISVSGLATTSLNSTWTLSEVLTSTNQLVFGANVADTGPTADTGTASLIFAIGDVAEDTNENEWFIWDQLGNVTNTWADWVLVTNPSTVALCATVATQVLPNLLSQRTIAVGQDVATGQYQNIPADLNAALADVMALSDATYQPLDSSLANYTIASGSYVQDSILYFVGADEPVLANVGPVGVSLMNATSAGDAQAVMSVTDSGWTGTATKIQSANFLSTYLAARGTL